MCLVVLVSFAAVVLGRWIDVVRALEIDVVPLRTVLAECGTEFL